MMKKFLLRVLMVCVGMMFGVAIADTARVTWQAPTEREDNTPIAPEEIAGFNVFDTQGVEVLEVCDPNPARVTCLPSAAREFTIPTTSAIRQLFMTTVDTDERQSVYSQAIVIPATVGNPKPVTGITVTVTP